EDGKYIVLRFHEFAGSSQNVTVTPGLVLEAGANILVAGSAVFGGDIEANIKVLTNHIEEFRNRLAHRTKDGGAEVIKLKGATFYGIAMAVSNIVETIMKDD
ncbi:hypothetical protein NE462_27450, partial [Blautia hominis]|nr:hypothetical protein [Blautia hominis]